MLHLVSPRVHDEGSAVKTGGGTGHENEVQHDAGTKTHGTAFYQKTSGSSDYSESPSVFW